MLPRTTANRIAELEQHAADTGTALPTDALVICTMEDAGFVVDLATGDLLYSSRTTFAASGMGRTYAAYLNGAPVCSVEG